MTHLHGTTSSERSTGWVEVAHSGLSSGALRFSRVGNTVYVNAGAGEYRLLTITSTAVVSGRIPFRFLPTGTEYVTLLRDDDKSVAGLIELQESNNGGVGFKGPLNTPLQSVTAVYLTTRPFS